MARVLDLLRARMAIGAIQSRAMVQTGSGLRPASSPNRPALKAVDAFERPKSVVVPALHRGMTGAAVRAMQLKLVTKGYLSRGDFGGGAGVFGPRTETAVKRMQIEHGLPVTGVLDARSTAALNAERPAAKNETSEVKTDVFEKPASLLSAMQTVTDEDEATAAS
ncbi:MAG: peptidoglycan-binding protein [Myxococcaceae bacterium]|nr:peptidoglycan-binding protein [Myxococcaceae bacterium]